MNQAIKNVSKSHDVVVDLLKFIGSVLNRPYIYGLRYFI